MGQVELVIRREGSFGRAYARKRLLPSLAEDASARAMFLEEGRIAGLVRHAHVVPVIDVGEDDDGPYLLLELVDGVSVAELIERLGARIPVQVAVEIARQTAEGLHAAHELRSPRGAMELVHRDLSPANVLVGFDGVARVTDFGVAKARDRAARTQVGVVIGKRSYMPPEQLRAEKLDRRADLFALGVVLAEMLIGGPLHGSASPSEVARRTLEEPPPDPGDERDDLPPELVALVFELMARRVEDRPGDARTVASRLARIGAALRADEDPLDVGELVRSTFDDRRRARQRELDEALRDERGEIGSATPILRAAPAAAPPRGWTGAIGAIAGVTALVIAAAALYAVIARDGSIGAEETGTAPQSEPEARGTDTGEAAASTGTTATEAEGETETGAAVGSATEGSSEVAGDARTGRTRRRVRRTQAPGEPEGPPTWSW